MTFLCRKEDDGVIAAPVRAKTALPDWFRKLPPIDAAHVSLIEHAVPRARVKQILSPAQPSNTTSVAPA